MSKPNCARAGVQRAADLRSTRKGVEGCLMKIARFSPAGCSAPVRTRRRPRGGRGRARAGVPVSADERRGGARTPPLAEECRNTTPTSFTGVAGAVRGARQSLHGASATGAAPDHRRVDAHRGVRSATATRTSRRRGSEDLGFRALPFKLSSSRRPVRRAAAARTRRLVGARVLKICGASADEAVARTRRDHGARQRDGREVPRPLPARDAGGAARARPRRRRGWRQLRRRARGRRQTVTRGLAGPS